MNKSFFFLLFFTLTFNALFAQEEDETELEPTAVDSLAQQLEGQGVVIQEVTYVKERTNPLAPSKAAFYSAVLPGLGQLYNKRGAWWKIPVIYGGLATGVSLYTFNNDEFQRARTAFKRRLAGFTDDEFFGDGESPAISNEALQSVQENVQSTRDLWLVLTIVWYSLNIIEANVTAHLAQYNVSTQLSFDFQPYLELNPITNDPNYGMALVFKF
ncbi:DUF5683 domain-containing protein [Flagellimonas sp. S174]|uniref:DUF5683 domain-containing protein n=1 Tax=Flagellimonas sp. S174 TaxID=3410790 RepID=UPI003BF56377